MAKLITIPKDRTAFKNYNPVRFSKAKKYSQEDLLANKLPLRFGMICSICKRPYGQHLSMMGCPAYQKIEF